MKKDDSIIMTRNEFFDFQSPEFKDTYSFFLSDVAFLSSSSDAIDALAAYLVSNFKFPAPAAVTMAPILYTNFTSHDFAYKFQDSAVSPIAPHIDTSFSSPSAFLYQSDIDAFFSLVSVDPHDSPQLRALLLSLLIHFRRDFHPNGWIKYDRRSIIHIAGLSFMAPKDVSDLLNYLHSEYALEMRVVGSNSPIPCFKFDWLTLKPTTPPLILGAFSPKTVAALLANNAATLRSIGGI